MRILICDDSKTALEKWRLWATTTDVELLVIDGPYINGVARQQLLGNPPSLVVTDLYKGNGEGYEAGFAMIKELVGMGCTVVVSSKLVPSSDENEFTRRAKELGVVACYSKISGPDFATILTHARPR